MIENLHDILKNSILPSTVDNLVAHHDITESQAKEMIREMTFSDYMDMQEASVDMNRPTTPTNTVNTPPGQAPEKFDAFKAKQGDIASMLDIQGNAVNGTIVGERQHV